MCSENLLVFILFKVKKTFQIFQNLDCTLHSNFKPDQFPGLCSGIPGSGAGIASFDSCIADSVNGPPKTLTKGYSGPP